MCILSVSHINLLSVLIFHQGRQELAQQSKAQGNKCFKEGKYEEAIQFYTEAIKTCPPDVKADMSTFYQNRAAAYENLVFTYVLSSHMFLIIPNIKLHHVYIVMVQLWQMYAVIPFNDFLHKL